MTKGDRIKRLRTDRNMTQPELAGLIGTTKQTIYKYENGTVTNIPSDKIEAMAQIFNVSPSYILGWPDEAQEKNREAAAEAADLSEVKQMLIEEILAADDADIAELVSYLKIKRDLKHSAESHE